MRPCFALLLVLVFLLAALSGCVPESLAGLVDEPMDAALFEVLDAPTQAFFASFDAAPPLCMTVNYDQHYPVAIVYDQAQIRALYEAAAAIRITAKTQMASTDGYHSVDFFTEDGQWFGIGFENGVLHENGERYVLDNDKAF